MVVESMNGFLRIALELARVPSNDIADLEKNLPAMARLCKLAKQLEPIITRNQAMIEAMDPDIKRALSVVKEAWPDIVAVTPTVQEFVTWINS